MAKGNSNPRGVNGGGGESYPNVIEGSKTGDDLLIGTAADDLIRGLGGNDQLFGDVGNDVIEGGLGQ